MTNSEAPSASGGGASAIRFAPDGAIVDAYRILAGTEVNCAGGPTPWGTWLSCEEFSGGMVWECDPADRTAAAARARPALGVFNHEAAAVDPTGKRLYLSEDRVDGGFYRFTPSTYPNLEAGLLEVAVVNGDGGVAWREVADPTGISAPTRRQVPEMTRFNGGEGLWFADGVCYFTTKGDKRVWSYEPARERLEVLFDRQQALDSALDAVDNVTVSAAGEIFVCEDGGNMEIGLISPERTVSPFLRFVGPDHQRSEVCGAAFDPSGTRLYLTSQRAFPAGPTGGPTPPPGGAVYEVKGPFNQPPTPTPDRGSAPPGGGSSLGVAYPLPAGEMRPGGRLNPGRDRSGPRIRVAAPRRVSRLALLRRGIPVRVKTSEPARVSVLLTTPNLKRRPDPAGGAPRPRIVRLARATARVRGSGRQRRFRLRIGSGARIRLRRRPTAQTARLLVTAIDRAGNRRTVVRTVRIGAASPLR